MDEIPNHWMHPDGAPGTMQQQLGDKGWDQYMDHREREVTAHENVAHAQEHGFKATARAEESKAALLASRTALISTFATVVRMGAYLGLAFGVAELIRFWP